jgi:hypothetical protein
VLLKLAFDPAAAGNGRYSGALLSGREWFTDDDSWNRLRVLARAANHIGSFITKRGCWAGLRFRWIGSFLYFVYGRAQSAQAAASRV